ncbi:helix-turn-helix transcriptional regulator [Mucilaginibacter phyllosphaerae]|uniref:DNA-binding CsgD family transcriptional regulator n=1 Tax=Mucilaginibacter phyllosphaerae TaxID=1812349 RepID=A0A4Y8AJI2_9SPHI|nr:hypothetical protein [Mucilaginibacter phyllosphaerae]MBB3967764.1 DNA-binding CsgD family transcriptional regulator [Mucilaginibacter phyllosphaerae]TEW69188.1 hypothetical protein E2R65_03205 [Mucilaginibacter phyllosphaerae]GGH03496.1 hypothetical protein GCM10007352_06190 [Mucilaginibacter phyllosphaerae]
MNAIFTADIVNSSSLNQQGFDKLIGDLKNLFKTDNKDFYNGDSFRVLIKQPGDALMQCIKSRLLAIQCSGRLRVDIRVSINIGNLQSKQIDLRSSMDELLVQSGRSFTRLQNTTQRLYITAGDKDADFTYDIIAEYTDTLLEQVTAKQAQILFLLLSGKTQVETAHQLALSTATISKQVKAARYDKIKSVLHKFEVLTNQLQHGK